MARSNTGSTSNYLANANAPVTASGFTLAGWFNPVNLTSSGCIVGVSDSGGSNYASLVWDGSNEYAIRDNSVVFDPSGSPRTNWASTNTVALANTWNHACGVWASNTSRSVYLNGTGKASDTDSHTPTSWNRCSVGAFRTSSATFDAINGAVAECAIWNVALDDAEIAALAAGFCPLLIRPTSLVAYWPLIGRVSPEPDLKGGFPLTITGTVSQTDHPRILYRADVQTIIVSGGSNVSVTPAVSAAKGVGIAPTVIKGSTSSTPAVSVARCIIVAPTVVQSSISITPAVGAAKCVGISPSVIYGPIVPTVSSARCAGISPSVIYGPIVPETGVIKCAGIAPTVVCGSITVSSVVGSARCIIVTPTVIQSSITVVSSISSAKCAGINPSVIYGPIVPAISSARCSVVSSTVIQSSITVIPVVSSARCSGIDPNIGVGSIIPDKSIAKCIGVNPTVTLSSTSVIPSVGRTSCKIIDPSVIYGSLIFTSTSSIRCKGIDPTTIVGSITLGPIVVTIKCIAVAPITIKGPITLGPIIVSAKCAAIPPATSGVTFSPSRAIISATSIEPTILLGSTLVVPVIARAKCQARIESDGDSIIYVTHSLGFEQEVLVAHITITSTYGTIFDADAYFSDMLEGQRWLYTDIEKKRQSLLSATKRIDRLNFSGDKANSSQVLQFPRGTDTLVPVDIEQACYELALVLLKGVDPDTERDNLSTTLQAYGGLRSEYDRSFVPPYIAAGIPSATAWNLLLPYLDARSGIELVRIS